MYFLWKCKPEVQCEEGGRTMVVFRTGKEGVGGWVGMWYVTADGPERWIEAILGELCISFFYVVGWSHFFVWFIGCRGSEKAVDGGWCGAGRNFAGVFRGTRLHAIYSFIGLLFVQSLKGVHG